MPASMWLNHRYREQARSHIGSSADTNSMCTWPPCGSELARDEAGTSNIFIDCDTAFASKPAPTGETRSHQEPGRLLGRLAVDVDLGRPVNHDGRTQELWSGHPGMDAGIAALGHGWPFAAAHGAMPEGTPSLSEVPSGGAKSVLVTFALSSKVTRRQGGTLSRRYRSNGYTPPPNEQIPRLTSGAVLADGASPSTPLS